jgi:hypothetical protein
LSNNPFKNGKRRKEVMGILSPLGMSKTNIFGMSKSLAKHPTPIILASNPNWECPKPSQKSQQDWKKDFWT